MPSVPIHHSSEHASGPGANPGSGHGQGQLTNRSRAQVGDTRGQAQIVKNEASSKNTHFPPGCALWMERLCPLPLSCKPATTTLPWELRS